MGAMDTKKRGKPENLRPTSQMTPEERKSFSSKGAKASHAAQRRKRSMRELAGMMLDSKAPDKMAAIVQAVAPDMEDATTGAVMLAGQVNAATKGNAQAARYVTELAGIYDEDESQQDQRPWSCDLSLHIGRDFVDVHRQIAAGKLTDVWLPGGRGSLKSSYASLEIAMGLMADPDANALVIQSRRVNIRDATMAQMLWAFDILGVSDQWKPTGSTLRINNTKTLQAVVFRGCDEPKKIKSIKLRRGYWRYLWIEEADLLRGMAEVRSVRQTVSRSSVPVVRMYTFNPPRTRDAWANDEVARVRAEGAPGECVVDSCYTDAPVEWLGEQFIADAEALKAADPESYRHEYLGEAVGYGSEVFDRVEIRDLTDEEWAAATMRVYGVDWGFSQDPYCFVALAYDPKSRILYVIDEVSGHGLTNTESAALVKEHLDAGIRQGERVLAEPEPYATVACDAAEPKSIADYRELGIQATGAKKTGSCSIKSGIRWLQQRAKIVIRPECRLAAKEFSSYAYLLDAEGKPTSTMPDADNHAIDAARYALATIISDRRFI